MGAFPTQVTHGDAHPARPPQVRVWDPFVRVFHWSLVAAFTTAWITGDEYERVHEFTGYAIAGLLAARIVWGLVGTRHARFGDFVRRPSVVLGYLRDLVRGRAERHLGHNPAGGAMIVTLLATLVVSVATGLAMTVGGFGEVHWIEEVHEAAANLALALVVFHVLGVLVSSLVHRENLVRAMFTGKKRV